MEKTIFKKYLTFKPSRPGGGTFHLEIELKEKSGKYRDWNSLGFVENPITLSICGCSRGGRGQCQNFIETKIGNFKQSDQVIIRQILNIWREYHLNDMNAGTKHQTEILYDFESTSSINRYTEQCTYLESKGILYDRGYKYGTGWLYREIPEDVVEFLKSL